MNRASMSVAIGVIAMGVAAMARAGDTPSSEANPSRTAYLRYCSACHGPAGKGDGVVSGAMRPPPPDLTGLAKANGGRFPYVTVRDVIDGRKHIAAHGTSAMPVWGEVFSDEKAAAQSGANVRGQVQLITDYLASIQAQ
jgi:mono/diheme cytochrome c family protein